MRQRLQDTIHLTDEASPTRKTKPAGVMGAEAIRAAPPRKFRTGPRGVAGWSPNCSDN